MRTIRVETELPTNADKVWRALQHPASFSYVTRGLIGLPALTGRTEPLHTGESGSGWLLLFHVIPLWRHTIQLVDVDAATRTLRSREHGGIVKRWNHTLHVEPVDEERCRYSDTVEIDAGHLTRVVAASGVVLYRYRHRRWRKLVRKHLLPVGPRFSVGN